ATYMTSSTLHQVFNEENNGQKLKCVIEHPSFAMPDVTIVPITIYFSPGQKQVHTFYQISLTSPYEVFISFSANPHPTALMWSYESIFQKMAYQIQIPTDNGKFSTSLI
ncbi:unnamed protein product, partial [Meganyctiphanes norvegica]